MKYAVAWLVLMMSLAALAGGFNLVAYLRLATRGVTVQGAVTQVIPKVHEMVRYRYYVNGLAYHGQRGPGQPNPPIARLSEGAVLTVWYDPDDIHAVGRR